MADTWTIIGVDAATEPGETGVALGILEKDKTNDRFGQLRLKRAGRRAGEKHADPTILEEALSESHILIAIDAPLGWPHLLAPSLTHHFAGLPIYTPKDSMFHRETDNRVKDFFCRQGITKQPLEVGANLIARTAHAALEFLDGLQERNGGKWKWQLAWDPDSDQIPEHVVIEVYPAATLKSHGMPYKGYKGTTHAHQVERCKIVDGLQSQSGSDHRGLMVIEDTLHDDSWILPDGLRRNDDVLDAAICVLAGADFLRGWAMAPPRELESLARREGWIWVKDPDTPA